MEDTFEALDGGHCYLRARLLSGYVVIERWPARASLDDVVQLGKWAERLWQPIQEQAADPVDYTKPHAFDLDRESGLKHTEYRVCKCGLSEGNVLHI